MVSQTSTEPQASPLPDAQAGTAASVPPMKSRDRIEVANQGSGPVNDPPASDTKPPNNCDFDSYLA
jgi:hypothetical protein